jgi:hypothetical protein
MPHRAADFGRAFWDAMVGGTPVVALRTAASIATFEKGWMDYTLPLNDAEGLAGVSIVALRSRHLHDRGTVLAGQGLQPRGLHDPVERAQAEDVLGTEVVRDESPVLGLILREDGAVVVVKPRAAVRRFPLAYGAGASRPNHRLGHEQADRVIDGTLPRRPRVSSACWALTSEPRNRAAWLVSWVIRVLVSDRSGVNSSRWHALIRDVISLASCLGAANPSSRRVARRNLTPAPSRAGSRTGARPVGEGYLDGLFRVPAGFPMPPWPRFQCPLRHTERADFPPSAFLCASP